MTFQPSLPGMPKRQRRRKGTRLPKDSVMSMGISPEALAKAVSNNEFKNLFEVPGRTQDTPLISDKAPRIESEKRTMGIPEDAPSSKRPVYGFLRSSKHSPRSGPLGSNPAIDAQGNPVFLYGEAVVDFKPPSPKSRITASPTDTFVETAQVSTLSSKTPVTNPEVSPRQSGNVTELQFHDRPKPKSDITNVHLLGAEARLPYVTNYNSRGQSYTNLRQEQDKYDDEREAVIRAGGYTGPVHRWRRRSWTQPSLFDDSTRNEPREFQQGVTYTEDYDASKYSAYLPTSSIISTSTAQPASEKDFV